GRRGWRRRSWRQRRRPAKVRPKCGPTGRAASLFPRFRCWRDGTGEAVPALLVWQSRAKCPLCPGSPRLWTSRSPSTFENNTRFPLLTTAYHAHFSVACQLIHWGVSEMLDDEDRKEFARLFPQFAASLPAAGLRRLLDHASRVDAHPGYNIFRDRMPTDAVHFVLAGEADVFVEHGDRTVHLGQLGPGALFGEISVLSRQLVASSTVQARTRMRTLRLRHQPLEQLLVDEEAGPALLDLLTQTLASRLAPQ